ncbi:MAG: nucleotide exchange factor GrpE [Candidatus Falkowbacteria bacterium]|nr:nucleotide exchange factor GrpE [Candidatus Falkowbacteria bacterium]
MESKKENQILVAAHGFIINSQNEILLLKEKDGDLLLGLTGLISLGHDPLEVIKRKALKELNLKVNNFAIFDSGLVDGLLVLRFIATDFSGEVKLEGKYAESSWHSFSAARELKNICPHVKKALAKMELELEKSASEQKYLRALADYQNLLRQHASDKSDFVKFALSSFLEEILPVYDHLKMSVASLPEEEKNNSWVMGVTYVLKQFKETLESHGIEEIKTVGENFDHHTMEALEGQGEKVTKEIMAGYKLNSKLIRAAKVVVGE